MSDLPRFDSLDTARRDGEAFGHMVGTATASEMARVASEPDQVSVVGVQGVDVVMARAERLADVNADRAIVEAWTEAAAEAFSEEVDRATLLLTVAPVVDLKH
jgi:hypothetical protein